MLQGPDSPAAHQVVFLLPIFSGEPTTWMHEGRCSRKLLVRPVPAVQSSAPSAICTSKCLSTKDGCTNYIQVQYSPVQPVPPVQFVHPNAFRLKMNVQTTQCSSTVQYIFCCNALQYTLGQTSTTSVTGLRTKSTILAWLPSTAKRSPTCSACWRVACGLGTNVPLCHCAALHPTRYLYSTLTVCCPPSLPSCTSTTCSLETYDY